MSLASPSVAEILDQHVTLQIEGIDRLYLNAYVPRLQFERGAASFFRFHRGQAFASSALMSPMSRVFVQALEQFATTNHVPLITFHKRQRKDDIAAGYRAKFQGEEGVLFIGKAQEKVGVLRTEKRRNPRTGQTYPWLVRGTAMVNQYYVYAIDRDFGPFFLKFSSYFPYNAKLCLNGHEYLKRQLRRRGIPHQALDNGILSCQAPQRAQAICDELSAEKIELFFRKWLRLVPSPFTAADRKAGYLYDLSILQAEFSLTQVLDEPVAGRFLFEQVIRENLDLGRPDQVQLIFQRRLTKKTPGRFRTRVITQGVIPSLHLDYKKTRIKQYHKEGRALRTETTINDTRDFRIGKRLTNLPALRKIGFQANRRLLDVQRLSHDPVIGERVLRSVVRPVEVNGQRAASLRFDDPRVQALFAVLVLSCLQLRGFSNRDLREPLARLLGLDPAHMTPGRMSYDLRRLRLHGLIERLPLTHRYRLTPLGLRVALFFCRAYSRLLRPTLAQLHARASPGAPLLQRAFDQIDLEITRRCQAEKLVA